MKYETKDGGFTSAGEFFVTVRKWYDGTHKDSRLIFEKTAGHMESGDDAQGGFLVPEQWAGGIYHAALENSIVRSRVMKGAIIKAKSDSVKVLHRG